MFIHPYTIEKIIKAQNEDRMKAARHYHQVQILIARRRRLGERLFMLMADLLIRFGLYLKKRYRPKMVSRRDFPAVAEIHLDSRNFSKCN